jgi:hypothetical protein
MSLSQLKRLQDFMMLTRSTAKLEKLPMIYGVFVQTSGFHYTYFVNDISIAALKTQYSATLHTYLRVLDSHQ